MALISTINTADNFQDQAMILGFREARQYNLNIEDYSDIRVCILHSLVETSTLQPTSSVFNENNSAARDYFWFGLKDNNADFPSDTNFVGHRFNPSSISSTNVHRYSGDFNVANSSSIVYSSKEPQFYIGGLYNPSVSGSVAGPANAYVARFTVLDKGTSTQKIRIYNPSSNTNRSSHAAVDNITKKYTSEILQSVISSTSWTNNSNWYSEHPWTSGGSALSLPKSLFMYCPLSSRRLCIHGVAIQIEN